MIICLVLATSVTKPVKKRPTVYPVVTTESKLAEAVALSLMSKYWNKVGE